MKSGYMRPEIKEQIQQNHPKYFLELQELKDEIVSLRQIRDELKSGNNLIISEKLRQVDSSVANANKLIQDANRAKLQADERNSMLNLRENKLEETIKKHLGMLDKEKNELTVVSEKNKSISDMLERKSAELSKAEKDISYARSELDANQKAFVIKNQEFNKQISEYNGRFTLLKNKEAMIASELNKLECDQKAMAEKKLALCDKDSELSKSLADSLAAKDKAMAAEKSFNEEKSRLAYEAIVMKAKVAQADEKMNKANAEIARIQSEINKLEELKKYIIKEGA